MPSYDYYCEENGLTVEVNHPVSTTIKNWGELCYVAQIEMGTCDPIAPVKRVIRTAPGVSVPKFDSEIKNTGFTKLVKRDDGVYENVTATGDEKRYMKKGDAESVPHLHKKVGD